MPLLSRMNMANSLYVLLFVFYIFVKSISTELNETNETYEDIIIETEIIHNTTNSIISTPIFSTTNVNANENSTDSSPANKLDQTCFTKAGTIGICKKRCGNNERQKSSKCAKSEFCCSYKEVFMPNNIYPNKEGKKKTIIVDSNLMEQS